MANARWKTRIQKDFGTFLRIEKSGFYEFQTLCLSNPDTWRLDLAFILGHFELLDPLI